MTLLIVAQWTALALTPFTFIVLYIFWDDQALKRIPPSAQYFSQNRCTVQDVHAMAENLARSPIKDKENLPPKTGRRYIVAGGGGFLGGWIATKLLERGENPHNIRLLDISSPVNYAVKDALSTGMQFFKVDITDAVAVEAAFKAPWPKCLPSMGDTEPEITVFQTVANIRFYERHLEFLDRSAKVNIRGTQNIIDAARAVGATVLIFTSSGSVGVRRTRFFLWPWETEPERFVQVINDDNTLLPKRHEEFFSNYAVTKLEADKLVRAADRLSTGPAGGKSMKVLRTGCIRPGNGIFGPRGDMLCGAYLVRKVNPTWIASVVQSFSYVENCAAAHLCYEARLIELLAGGTNPDIGGQAFCIADPGTTPTYGDVYTTLSTLSEGECQFPSLSPTTMLIISHLVEKYYRWHFRMLSEGWRFAKKLPAITGNIINLQPSLFALTSVHLIFDDSRARLSPEKGGLGYSGTWTTLEGVHKTYEEYKSGVGRSETRSATAGLPGSSFSMFRKAKVVAKANASDIPEPMPVVGPVEVLTAN